MSLNDATDAQVAALRALAQGGLNAELAATITEDAVVSTLGWPAFGQSVPLRVPQLRLPALAIYRENEGTFSRSMQIEEADVIFRFDYVASATPVAAVGARWSLLRLVWKELVELLCEGKHASVSGGAAVLELAGFTEVVFDQRFPRVQYLSPVADQAVHPTFRGEVRMRHREEVDISALPDLTLQTEVYPVDLPDDEREDFEAGGESFASEVHS